MARQTERLPQFEDWGYEILPYAESVRRGSAAIEALDRNMEAFALYERDSDPTVSNGIARDVSGSDASATPKTPSSGHDRHLLDVVVGPPEAQALHDLDLEMNPLNRHLDWVTDPDSPYMQEGFERDLQRGVDELVRGATKVRSRLKGKIPIRRVVR